MIERRAFVADHAADDLEIVAVGIADEVQRIEVAILEIHPMHLVSRYSGQRRLGPANSRERHARAPDDLAADDGEPCRPSRHRRTQLDDVSLLIERHGAVEPPPGTQRPTNQDDAGARRTLVVQTDPFERPRAVLNPSPRPVKARSGRH